MSTINLTAQDDQYMGDVSANNVNGLGGSDVMSGAGGDDMIFSGSQTRYLLETEVTETFYQDSSLFGDATLKLKIKKDLVVILDHPDMRSDRVNGDEGNDIISGADGHDFLYGGSGNDYLYGGFDPISQTQGRGSLVTDRIEKVRYVIDQDKLYYFAVNENFQEIYVSTGRDRLEGGDGNDVINGGDDDDVLMGQAGADRLYGGQGVQVSLQTYAYMEYDDDPFSPYNYEDIRYSKVTVSYYSSGGKDVLYGQDGNDELNGEDGDDLLIGGADQDTIYGGDGQMITAFSGTSDEYTSRSVMEEQYVYGGKDQLYGGTGHDHLLGQDDDDQLYGGSGDDVLYGGLGSTKTLTTTEKLSAHKDPRVSKTTMVVQGGNDLLYGDSGNDVIYAEDGDDRLYGGTGIDQLYGGAGHDTLYDTDGLDQLDGGLGDDVYILLANSATPIERANEGTDRIEIGKDYTLIDYIEDLKLLDGGLNGAGNALNNTLTGNSANNRLTGKDGDDVLVGLDGNDELRGGMGNDTLQGGVGVDLMWGSYGDDRYEIDHVGDQVTELDGQGIDSVHASLDYTLTNFVEHLYLTGTAISATGNVISNNLFGNQQDNLLSGLEGFDRLYGADGKDQLYGGVGNDRLYGGAGDDQLYGGVGDDLIYGTAGQDYLYGGGAGRDKLFGGEDNDYLYGGLVAGGIAEGGAGDDYYLLYSATTVTEVANQGYDVVESQVSITRLFDQVEELRLAGTAHLNGQGNALNNKIYGNAGNNVLSGQQGADILNGGAGSDTYDMKRGYGLEAIFDTDRSGVDTDIVLFENTISIQSLWFTQSGLDLNIQIIGTDDRVLIKNWYKSDSARIEEFVIKGQTKKMLDQDVQTLVNQMASMTPPAVGQTELSAAQVQQLQPVWNLVWK
jgi:Ca2+-binding RTX toxin-like protein